MKKLIYLFLVLSLFLCCRTKQEKIERLIEDGVEVIVNHLEPYQIKDEPTTFILEEEFVIDTEREDLAELGIGTISTWDVNPEGDIYLVSRGQIFKFDKKGNFVKIIGQKGQGPGDFQSIRELRITKSGELSFYDYGNVKYLFFTPDGTFKEERKVTSDTFIHWIIYLDNGNFMIRERQNEPEKGMRKFHFALLDKNFNKIGDLQPSYWIEVPYYQTDKFSLLPYAMSSEIIMDKIFVSSNMREDLEIEVYNFRGDLLRKIRKESERLKISKEYKEENLKRWEKAPAWEEWDLKRKHYFPDYFPPFKMFWVDDDERIFVETYEEGERAGEALFYIFNPEGIFVSIKSLKKASFRKFKNNRLYCVYRKDSGYEKFVAYTVSWK
ncbi:MAG: 6-bladed beta-propeller [Candidatus Hodarchaeales archaeon]|jgi:hypothetical protein